MGTRSTIRIKRKDGTQAGIYCHWDGYVEHNGVMLQLYYNTAEKLEKLLALGNLSVLQARTEPDAEQPHDFGEPQKGVCVAYHRDRGEEYYQSDSDIGGGIEFVYTFDEQDAVWYVTRYKQIKQKSFVQTLLDFDYPELYESDLLLDAILASDSIDKVWTLDEGEQPIEIQCCEAAKEARKEIIEQNRAEREAYYRACCD